MGRGPKRTVKPSSNCKLFAGLLFACETVKNIADCRCSYLSVAAFVSQVFLDVNDRVPLHFHDSQLKSVLYFKFTDRESVGRRL